MKKSTILLAATLAANAVLLGVLWSKKTASTAAGARNPAVARGSGAARNSDSAVAVNAGQGGATAAPGGSVSKGLEGDWDALYPNDPTGLAAALRAAGYPANIVSAMVHGAISTQFAPRWKEFYGVNDPIPPFWSEKGGITGFLSTTDPDKRKLQMALNDESSEMAKAALGDDYFGLTGNPEALENYRLRYGDLSSEKIVAIQKTLQDFSRQQQEIYNRAGTGSINLLPDDREEMARIEKDRRAAIAALLTPGELENYDMRSSPTANTLRNQLAAFEPTEEEFRALYRVQKEFDERFPTNTPLSVVDQDLLRQRQAELPALQERLAAALPPERVADYKLSIEPGSAQLSRLMTRLEMPKSLIPQILNVQKDIQARARAVTQARTAAALTEEHRQQLLDLHREATNRVTELIGERGLGGYKMNGGGWIEAMVPPPVTASPRGGL